MARVQVGYDPRAEALQTTAAPNIATEQARFDPRASSAFQLAEALGKAQPVIDQFNQDYERKKAQDALLQNMKVESYKEQFQRDNKDGAVTAAQVKEKFPETVPVVAARVAESIGLDFGRTLQRAGLHFDCTRSTFVDRSIVCEPRQAGRCFFHSSRVHNHHRGWFTVRSVVP